MKNSMKKKAICLALSPAVVLAAINDVYSQPYAPDIGSATPAVVDGTGYSEIVAANDSLFGQAFFNQPMTSYAVGWKDPNNLDATLEFFAPKVMTPRWFTYAQFVNAEEFYSETMDDARAMRADFKTVEYNSSKVAAKVQNRGLRMVVDIDEVADKPNWQEIATGKLLRRMKRNSIRRAISLIQAGAVTTAKVWGTAAGTDADMDVINELVLAATASGVPATRIGYGDTAWATRLRSLRSQNTPAGYGSTPFKIDELSSYLGLDQGLVSKERFQSTASAKSEIVGTSVLMFNAMTGADTEDPSNIKRFSANTDQGGEYAVYIRQITTKLWEVVVEKYESIVLTSTLGIRQFTVTPS